MATIDIQARHELEHSEAQQAAEDLSRDLAQKFGIEYGWDGDVIHFERPGVQGQILVQGDNIHIQAYLGFMLALLKGPIEREIYSYLKEHFGCSF